MEHHEQCPAPESDCQCSLIATVRAEAFREGRLAGAVGAEQTVRLMARSASTSKDKAALTAAAKRIAAFRNELDKI